MIKKGNDKKGLCQPIKTFNMKQESGYAYQQKPYRNMHDACKIWWPR